MRNYEVTFIIDPVLSSDEIKQTAKSYEDYIASNGGEIVHVNPWGLRQLAYPINKRSTGIYYTIEFKVENGAMINPMELVFRRDEKIMRFLTIGLDKFGVQFNQDKRDGKIGKVKKKPKKEEEDKGRGRGRGRRR